jgi:hypothetical protein
VPQTGLVLCFVFVLLGTLQGSTLGTTHSAVSGMLFDKRPVTNAEIDLQLLQDDHCAKLFVSRRHDVRAQQNLRACTRDLLSTRPDNDGRYRFADLAPGWYAIHIVWSMAEKPPHPREFKRGDWAVAFPGYKDKTGMYDAFAQGKPFYISGESDVVKDYRNP